MGALPQVGVVQDQYRNRPEMTKAYFKNSIIVSLVGHTLAFFLFTFSFGGMSPKPDYAPLVFLGQILPKNFSGCPEYTNAKKTPWNHDGLVGNIRPQEREDRFRLAQYCLKPRVGLSFNTAKADFTEKTPAAFELPVQQKESVIMFHPLLPYQLQLYFKDRQSVHIELMFNIVPSEDKNSIMVKRKISSGNLEADLLSKRYMEHYLFIQQARFPLNAWQTVKIDLSNY